VGTGSTYGVCEFALSWFITEGRFGGLDLAGLSVVHAVRPAAIELDHRPGRWFMRASNFVTVRANSAVPSELPFLRYSRARSLGTRGVSGGHAGG
jgi:hypothetical protein